MSRERSGYLRVEGPRIQGKGTGSKVQKRAVKGNNRQSRAAKGGKRQYKTEKDRKGQ